MKYVSRCFTVLCALLACALVGCQALKPRKDTSRFFSLSRLGGGGAEATAPACVGSLAVLPPVLPAYLQRPQIVERKGASELRIHEHYRWAEPLEDGFTLALAQRLSTCNGRTLEVRRFPDVAGASHVLRVEVYAFEARAEGSVVLDAAWRIDTTGAGSKTLSSGRCSVSAPWKAGDYEALPAALEGLIAQLANQVQWPR